MLNKDSIFAGVAIGLPFPLLALLLTHLFKYNNYLLNKPGLPYFIAIAANLLLLRYFFKQEAELTCRGLIITTFFSMLLILLLKIQFV